QNRAKDTRPHLGRSIQRVVAKRRSLRAATLRGDATAIADRRCSPPLVPSHSTTLGTTKRPFACRGALLNASFAVNQSHGASARNTLKTGSPCAAASTPVTSTWRSFLTYFS